MKSEFHFRRMLIRPYARKMKQKIWEREQGESRLGSTCYTKTSDR